MIYLIDTNACLDFLLQRSDRIGDYLPTMSGKLSVSTITAAELRVGAKDSIDPAKDDRTIDVFLSTLEVAVFDDNAATAYGSLVRRVGVRRNSFDRLIAAHALALNRILVTSNTRDFADIPGLRVENWT